MEAFRIFVMELKKLFKTQNASMPYETTYVTFIKLEERVVVDIFRDKLTLELKQYGYTAPGKNQIIFYRIVAQFGKNAFHNPYFKISIDEQDKAKKFYLKVSAFVQKELFE